MNRKFNDLASAISRYSGRSVSFAAAVGLILLWLPSFFIVGDFDTWQLLINTPTTIVTFLLVFVIQNTQNRDNAAFHVKLDIILQKLGADNQDLEGLETLPDTQLEQIQKQYQEKGAQNDDRRNQTTIPWDAGGTSEPSGGDRESTS